MAEGDDAMSSFDPWNTGLYKGVRLSGTDTAAENGGGGGGWSTLSGPAKVVAGAAGATEEPVVAVAFKKRTIDKGAKGKGKKQFKKKRTDDNDAFGTEE